MSKVILLEPQRFDVSSAAVYGEVVTLFPEDGMRSSVWESQFQLDLLKRLEEVGFDPRVDFVANTGSAVPLAIAIAEIVRTYGSIRLLLWNAIAKSYVPRPIGDYDVYHDAGRVLDGDEDVRGRHVETH